MNHCSPWLFPGHIASATPSRMYCTRGLPPTGQRTPHERTDSRDRPSGFERIH